MSDKKIRTMVMAAVLAALAARGSAEGVAAANGLRSAAEGRLTR